MLNTKKNPIDSYIRIRVSEEEKKFIKELANKKGLTITDLVKTSINHYAAEENK